MYLSFGREKPFHLANLLALQIIFDGYIVDGLVNKYLIILWSEMCACRIELFRDR